jgi:hypothetical protein
LYSLAICGHTIAVRSAAVLPIDLARQIFVIDSLGFGIWRGNNDKDAAKRLIGPGAGAYGNSRSGQRC